MEITSRSDVNLRKYLQSNHDQLKWKERIEDILEHFITLDLEGFGIYGVNLKHNISVKVVRFIYEIWA